MITSEVLFPSFGAARSNLKTDEVKSTTVLSPYLSKTPREEKERDIGG